MRRVLHVDGILARDHQEAARLAKDYGFLLLLLLKGSEEVGGILFSLHDDPVFGGVGGAAIEVGGEKREVEDVQADAQVSLEGGHTEELGDQSLGLVVPTSVQATRDLHQGVPVFFTLQVSQSVRGWWMHTILLAHCGRVILKHFYVGQLRSFLFHEVLWPCSFN
jgi:hypothetical protein